MWNTPQDSDFLRQTNLSQFEQSCHLLKCAKLTMMYYVILTWFRWDILIIIIIFRFYIVLNTNVSLYRYTVTPVIGFNTCPHTMCAQSPLPGEHSSQALLDALKMFDQQWRSHPTGYPFNTWVESSKCRLISCQRIYTIAYWNCSRVDFYEIVAIMLEANRDWKWEISQNHCVAQSKPSVYRWLLFCAKLHVWHTSINRAERWRKHSKC